MLTGTLTFFELNRRYSVLSGFTESLFPIIHEKTFLNARFNRIKSKRSQFRGKRNVYLSVVCTEMAIKARIL